MIQLAPALALFALAPAQAMDPSTDEQAIEAAVFDYFDGQGEKSEERLNRAFYGETAQMVGILKTDDGSDEVRTWEMKDVITNWAEGEPSEEERSGEIISMDIADGRLATVMFDSNGRFTDALTLAKIDGEWKIVQKVFIRQDQSSQ
ncbi:nuclear transport factor 2 family protein [Parvularcula maris]|uniref:Nuclear transport factor 2 family protein n=1 Tax=Parvularcula maris TaxID=2965077 RepID=A0A9X2LCU8_9PROT|nr:nuclear transport factor 2 family protein [Parvularcula maris]MCQ8186172.1 nuclear transport factor 2 family protein [Parvularcula maris]